MGGDLIAALVTGSFGLLLIVVGFSCVFHVKRLVKRGIPFKTVGDNDCLKVRDDIVGFIEKRVNEEVCCHLSDRDIKSMKIQDLKNSSDVVSLIRLAHYAGYHITIEQIPESDLDLDDGPLVFKTNLRKAQIRREERRMNRYRRY